MPYTPTTWTNETPSTTPVKYKITDDTSGVLANSAKIELVTSVTPGTPVDATRLNKIEQGIADAMDAAEDAIALYGVHVGARVYRNTTQTIPTGVGTALSFNTVLTDTASLYASANPTRLTAQEAGFYAISGHASYATNATGIRQLVIRVNGVTVANQQVNAASGTQSTLSAATLFWMAEGDYAELWAYHTAGANLDVASSAQYSPHFAMVRVG